MSTKTKYKRLMDLAFDSLISKFENEAALPEGEMLDPRIYSIAFGALKQYADTLGKDEVDQNQIIREKFAKKAKLIQMPFPINTPAEDYAQEKVKEQNGG